MKRKILSLLMLVFTASAFAQIRFMPIGISTDLIRLKQYDVFYDVVLKHYPDARYTCYEEGGISLFGWPYLFVEDGRLVVVQLDHDFNSYYYNAFRVPAEIKESRQNIKDAKKKARHMDMTPDMETELEEYLSYNGKRIKSLKESVQKHLHKPKISKESVLEVDNRFTKALCSLISLAALSATYIDNEWTQLDGGTYVIWPTSRHEQAVICQETGLKGPEADFINAMQNVRIMVDKSDASAAPEILKSMKDAYLGFLKYLPKDGNYYKDFESDAYLFD